MRVSWRAWPGPKALAAEMGRAGTPTPPPTQAPPPTEGQLLPAQLPGLPALRPGAAGPGVERGIWRNARGTEPRIPVPRDVSRAPTKREQKQNKNSLLMLSAAKFSPLARNPSAALTLNPVPKLGLVQESREEGRLSRSLQGPVLPGRHRDTRLGSRARPFSMKEKQAGHTKAQSGPAPQVAPGPAGAAMCETETGPGGRTGPASPRESSLTKSASFQASGVSPASREPTPTFQGSLLERDRQPHRNPRGPL